MYRYRKIVPAILLAAAMLSGCGSYKSDTATLYIEKDGSVVSCDVEDFDQSKYKDTELKDYVNNAVSAYTAIYGKNRVEMKDVRVKDNVATMILKYATVDDYNSFNGENLFYGTIEEAKAAGYTFDGNFASYDGKTATLCGVDDFYSDNDLHVVVTDQNYNIRVYHAFQFVSSQDAQIINRKTVSVQAGTDLFSSGSTGDTENTENAVSETFETETSETSSTETDSVTDGSITEDDLLAMAETEASTEFEFSEEDTDTEVTPVYIIFK